ncbi:MAG: SRPBCC family protein [Acidimicrobiia bacterium]
MSSIEVSIDLPTSLDEVWEAVSHLERHAEWMTDAESITFADEQRSGVGTTMDVLTRVGPLTTVDRIVVEEWTPPTTIAVTHRGIVSGEGAFHLAPTDHGTRFTWNEQLSFPWYLGGGITATLAKPVLRRIWRSNLERFSATLPTVAPNGEG